MTLREWLTAHPSESIYHANASRGPDSLRPYAPGLTGAYLLSRIDDDAPDEAVQDWRRLLDLPGNEFEAREVLAESGKVLHVFRALDLPERTLCYLTDEWDDARSDAP